MAAAHPDYYQYLRQYCEERQRAQAAMQTLRARAAEAGAAEDYNWRPGPGQKNQAELILELYEAAATLKGLALGLDIAADKRRGESLGKLYAFYNNFDEPGFNPSPAAIRAYLEAEENPAQGGAATDDIDEAIAQLALEIGEETVLFDITDAGALLYAQIQSPTAQEARQYSDGAPLELRYSVLQDTIIMLFRFGSLPWIDTPYHGSLSRKLSMAPDSGIDQSEGLPLHIIVVDADDGTIVVARQVVIGAGFSRSLMHEVRRQVQAPVTQAEHDSVVRKIYNQYTTKALLGLAENAWIG